MSNITDFGDINNFSSRIKNEVLRDQFNRVLADLEELAQFAATEEIKYPANALIRFDGFKRRLELILQKSGTEDAFAENPIEGVPVNLQNLPAAAQGKILEDAKNSAAAIIEVYASKVGISLSGSVSSIYIQILADRAAHPDPRRHIRHFNTISHTEPAKSTNTNSL